MHVVRAARVVPLAIVVALVSLRVGGAGADPLAYDWSPVAVQQPPATMHPGEIVTVTAVVRNDGTETWYGEDLSPTPVRLGTALPRDRVSPFAVVDPTWLWSGGKRVRMETPVVPPGALAAFSFTFRAPDAPPYPRAFTERFAPVAEGTAWMDARTVAFTTTVVPVSGAVPPIPSPPPVASPPPTPSPTVSPTTLPTPTPTQEYAWTPVAVQPAPATMHPGQKIVLSVALQNTGTATWRSEDDPTPFRLAAVNAPGLQPRERASAFGREDPTWIWSGGRRIRMETPEVRSGEIGSFTFTFTAPTLPSYPQTFVERFAPIVEGITLLDSAVVAFSTQVRPAAGPLPPFPETPPISSPEPLPTVEPLPTPSETPTIVPTLSPLPTPTAPPVPGATCGTSATARPEDLSPAAGYGYAANGTLLANKVTSPQAIAYGFSKIFAADTANDRIARTDLAGFATDYFGATGGGHGQMRWPGGIAISDSALVFVADTGNDRIQVWGFSGVYLTSFGSRGSGPGEFRAPRGISMIDNGPFAGMLAIADTGNDRIQIVTRAGASVAVIGGPGIAPGAFSSPTSVAVWGESIFVADTGNERIQRLGLDGSFTGAWGGAGTDAGCTSLPTGVIVNAYGVFVVESGSGRVERFTRWGQHLETFGTMATPTAFAMDATARIYVTEAGAARVTRFAPAAALAPPVP